MTGVHGVPEVMVVFDEVTVGQSMSGLTRSLPAAAQATETRPAEGQPSTDSRSTGAGQDAVEGIATTLANGLTELLVAAIRDLERDFAAQSQSLSHSFSQRLEKLQAAIEDLQPLKERTGQLAASVASLRDANARLENEIGILRSDVILLSSSVPERLGALASRLDLQEAEVSDAKSTASEVSLMVDALVERLDQQARTIRSICEEQTVSEVALDQFVEIWTRLRTSTVPPSLVADRRL
ncbi:MAG: hypothetical protein HY238_04525 [Acidobacteria bacterium]|nr:hypothetical protein [Acidobacteriota bacterium]